MMKIKTHNLILILLLTSIVSLGQPVDDPNNTVDIYTLRTYNVNTPKGIDIESLEYHYSYYNGQIYTDWTIEYSEGYREIFENNPINFNKEVKGNVTKTYNCHSYAWNTCEGGNYIHWINARLNSQQNGNGNLAKYWSTNGGYTQVSGINNASKIYYSDGDHSARIVSPSTGTVISKWGNKLLVEHPYNDCPYLMTNLHYYKLSNPIISGSSDAICNGSQQTLSETGFTHINVDYNWNNSSLLSEVSGNGTSQYTVQGTSQNGTASVSLTVTTPSGAVATANKAVWVGTPTPEAIDIINIGPYYPGGNQICTNRPNDGIINWNPFGGILEYDWQAGNWQVVQHPMDPFPDIPKQNVQLTAPYYGYDNPVSVTVRARNQCGWGNYLAPAIILNGVSCGGYYLVASPNPAGSYVEITLIPEADVSEVAGKTKIEQAGSNDGFGNYQIQLWSEQGGLLKTVQSDQLKLNLPVRDLPEGKYYLHLLKDGNIYKQQLLIQR